MLLTAQHRLSISFAILKGFIKERGGADADILVMTTCLAVLGILLESSFEFKSSFALRFSKLFLINSELVLFLLALLFPEETNVDGSLFNECRLLMPEEFDVS